QPHEQLAVTLHQDVVDEQLGAPRQHQSGDAADEHERDAEREAAAVLDDQPLRLQPRFAEVDLGFLRGVGTGTAARSAFRAATEAGHGESHGRMTLLKIPARAKRAAGEDHHVAFFTASACTAAIFLGSGGKSPALESRGINGTQRASRANTLWKR